LTAATGVLHEAKTPAKRTSASGKKRKEVDFIEGAYARTPITSRGAAPGDQLVGRFGSFP
jgi:hypothetical protein